MTLKAILIGAGGHARVVAEIALLNNIEIIGLVDASLEMGQIWDHGIRCLGRDELITTAYTISEIVLLNGIGSLPGDHGIRKSLFQKFISAGYLFPVIIHPRAIVSSMAHLESGTQVMAGAIINSNAHIGKNTIINTGSIVEHDCRIGADVHIAPGAVLSGGVLLNSGVHIGTGSVVIQNIALGSNVVVGAGAVVSKNIPDNTIVYPARSTLMDLTREYNGI